MESVTSKHEQRTVNDSLRCGYRIQEHYQEIGRCDKPAVSTWINATTGKVVVHLCARHDTRAGADYAQQHGIRRFALV